MFKDKIPVLINKSYGGFGLSDFAINEYNRRMLNIDKNHKIIKRIDENYRYDLLLIEIVKELGEKANNHYSKLVIEYINKELKDYVIIDEYDGNEVIDYNINAYLLDKIKNTVIYEQNLTNDEIVSNIKDIFNTDFTYAILSD